MNDDTFFSCLNFVEGKSDLMSLTKSFKVYFNYLKEIDMFGSYKNDDIFTILTFYGGKY